MKLSLHCCIGLSQSFSLFGFLFRCLSLLVSVSVSGARLVARVNVRFLDFLHREYVWTHKVDIEGRVIQNGVIVGVVVEISRSHVVGLFGRLLGTFNEFAERSEGRRNAVFSANCS